MNFQKKGGFDCPRSILYETMSIQVMSDDERLKQVTSLITRMVYEWMQETG